MNQEDLRILITVLYFVLFLIIIFWAITKRKSKDFKDAADLPLRDD